MRSIRTGQCYRNRRPQRPAGAAGVYFAHLGLPVHRDRGADRRRQVAARRSARRPPRRDGRPRRNRQSRSSPTSTPDVPARHSRRSCSSRSRATASRPRCARAISSASSPICDYLFERDKIYAYLNLDDNELFIYQRLYELLVAGPAGARSGHLPADADRRPAPPRCASASARTRTFAAARRRLRPGAQRGVQPFLLPLHRDAAAGRRDLAVRSVLGRRRARRPRAPDPDDGQGHAGTTCREPERVDCRNANRSHSRNDCCIRRDWTERWMLTGLGSWQLDITHAKLPRMAWFKKVRKPIEPPDRQEPGAGRPVGQVSVLRANHLQQGPRRQPERLHRSAGITSG